jgi:hypothetical protein
MIADFIYTVFYVWWYEIVNAAVSIAVMCGLAGIVWLGDRGIKKVRAMYGTRKT